MPGAIELPEPECWLHSDVEVRPSPIAGLGLFARAPIPAGVVVSRVGGRLVSAVELAELLSRESGERAPASPAGASNERSAGRSDAHHPYVDTITVAPGRHLVLPPGTPNGRGNHSCEPNLWWVGPYELATRRTTAADEELTNDYATSTAEPGFAMRCSCGAARCRGLITGDDWRRPELRDAYGDHWVPALLALVRATPE